MIVDNQDSVELQGTTLTKQGLSAVGAGPDAPGAGPTERLKPLVEGVEDRLVLLKGVIDGIEDPVALLVPPVRSSMPTARWHMVQDMARMM